MQEPFGNAGTGVIRKEKIVYDYNSLSWGPVSPTDIDGFMDFKGKMFVLVEGKGFGVPLNVVSGQHKMFLNLEFAITRSGEFDFLLVYFEHPEKLITNERGHIIANECKPTLVRYNGVDQDLSNFPSSYKIKDIVRDFGLLSCKDLKEAVWLFNNH